MAKFLITGAAGFIGANLAIKLTEMKHDVVLADDFENGKISKKLFKVKANEMLHFQDVNSWMEKQNDIEGVFHLGACSNTQEWNGNYLLENNYRYTKKLFEICKKKSIRLVYASSASVYGLGENGFSEVEECEAPINFYAYSKLLFDNFLRNLPPDQRKNTVGLRYFNVYGPHEDHKNEMASPVHKFSEQAINDGVIKIFADTAGVKKESHLRDFIHVDDCVDLNIFFMKSAKLSGIFNCGTGKPRSFVDVAKSIQKCLSQIGRKVEIKEIPMPEQLIGSYQFYTKANLEKLRGVGWDKDFIGLDAGISKFVDHKLIKRR